MNCQKLLVLEKPPTRKPDEREADESYSAQSVSGGKLKLNLQISDRAWKEYTRRSREISQVLDASVEVSTFKPLYNVSSLISQISGLNLSPLIESASKKNQELEKESWLLSTKLEETKKDSNHNIEILEHNLISVLKNHVSGFHCNLLEVESKLENFSEKVCTLIFGLIETVNSRLAHLEFKLAGITTFAKSLRHSLISSQVDYFNLQNNYKEIISDKQYLTEKLGEGFQLSKYLSNAVKTLSESKEYFEKVANVYQSKKSFEVFFEKLSFFEDSIEELHKHIEQANPYKKKLELLEKENKNLYEEVERLRSEIQKHLYKETIEVKSMREIEIHDNFESITSPLLSPRLSVAANAELMRILPGKIGKIMSKFEKGIKLQALTQLEECEEKVDTMKLWVKKAKLVQVSMKKRLLEMDSKEKMYLKEINKLTGENLKLVSSLDEAKSKIKSFSLENDELTQKIEKVFKEIQTRNIEKSSLVSQSNENKIKLSQYESELKQLKKTNEKVFYEYEKITAENQQNLMKRQEITLVYQTLEDKLRSQQEIIDKLRQENEDLVNRNESFEKNIKMYRSALESYEARVKDAELQLQKKAQEEVVKTDQLREVFEMQKVQLQMTEAQVKDLEVQNWNLEQKRLELTGKIKELKKENEKIKDLVHERQAESEKGDWADGERQSVMSKEIENWARRYDRSSKKVDKLRLSLEEKDRINEELSNMVERCSKEIELLQGKCKVYKTRVGKLKKSIVSIVVNLRSMHTTLSNQTHSLVASFSSELAKLSTTFKHDPKSLISSSSSKPLLSPAPSKSRSRRSKINDLSESSSSISSVRITEVDHN